MAKEPIVVEVADSRNRNLFFKPLAERLRGRWAYANVPGTSSHQDLQELAQKCPVIPGIRLSVDIERRVLRRYDPLREPEHQRTWEYLCDAANKNNQMFGSSRIERPEDATFRGESVTDDLIKDWLYWMRRAVNCGAAEVLSGSGELPKLDDIRRMPGKRRYMYSTSMQLKESEKYVDIVEPSDRRGGGGGGGSGGSGKQPAAA